MSRKNYYIYFHQIYLSKILLRNSFWIISLNINKTFCLFFVSRAKIINFKIKINFKNKYIKKFYNLNLFSLTIKNQKELISIVDAS